MKDYCVSEMFYGLDGTPAVILLVEKNAKMSSFLLSDVVIFDFKFEKHGGAHISLLLDQISFRLDRHDWPVKVANERPINWISAFINTSTTIRTCAIQNRLHLDARAQRLIDVLFLVVFFVEDHSRQRGIYPAGPLMEAWMLALALAEQLVAIQVHYCFRHRVLQLEWEHGHFKEFSFWLLSLLNTLYSRRSSARSARYSLSQILATDTTRAVSKASSTSSLSVLLPLGGIKFTLADEIHAKMSIRVVIRRH